MLQLIYFQSEKFWFYFAAVKSGSILVYLSTPKKKRNKKSQIYYRGFIFYKTVFLGLALFLVSAEKLVKQKEKKKERSKERKN